MLRKKKDERYQTMRDILTDLRDLQENLTLDEKLEKFNSRGNRNTTDVLRTAAGDANLRTNETQPSFSLAIKRHKPLAAIVSVFLLGGAIALAYYFYAARTQTVTNNGGKKSIAVLPIKPIGATIRDSRN